MIFLPDGRRLEVDGADWEEHVIQIANSPLVPAQADFLASQACVWDRGQTVHVVQGELATVPLAADGVAVLGSTDATTCLIAACVDARCSLASVAHYDESILIDSRSATASLVEGMERPSLFLVGAARCGAARGSAIATAAVRTLLGELNAMPIIIDLRLFCVLEWNTDAAGRPQAQGLALALPLGVPFLPEGWKDRGPMVDARMAQLWCDPGPELPIKSNFNGKTSEWMVTVAAGRAVASPGRRRRLQALVDLADEDILQECSTSPECELAHIAGDIRAALRWVLAQEGPLRLEQRRFRWFRGRGWVCLHDEG